MRKDAPRKVLYTLPSFPVSCNRLTRARCTHHAAWPRKIRPATSYCDSVYRLFELIEVTHALE